MTIRNTRTNHTTKIKDNTIENIIKGITRIEKKINKIDPMTEEEDGEIMRIQIADQYKTKAFTWTTINPEETKKNPIYNEYVIE